MSLSSQSNYLYLNQDNLWSGFQMRGLELEDGALRLAALPLLDPPSPPEDAARPKPGGAGGIAVARDGSIFYSGTAANAVWRIDGCDGRASRVSCLGTGGSSALRQPRGLLFHPLRAALLVADSGNHRVEVFETGSYELLAVWGAGAASDEPGAFREPWDLAADCKGNVYVVDYGNGRVQKFNASGDVAPKFWERLQTAGLLRPVGISVVNGPASSWIYILDADAHAVFVVDTGGRLLNRRSLNVGEASVLAAPLGLAADEAGFSVGDNLRKRIYRFDSGGTLVGQAAGYHAPVAALALGGPGALLALAGDGIAPSQLSARGAYGRQGVLWGGPFRNLSSASEQWHQVKAIGPDLPDNAHLQLFVYTASTDTAPPVAQPPADPFSGPAWTGFPADATECVVPGAPFDRVWVGVEFTGEGAASPVLRQMRIAFDHQSYLEHLPAIYKDDDQSRRFLARFLSLFQSFFEDVEREIGALPRLFDPSAAPPQFLDWLAEWLALDLNEDWTDARKRETIARAFAIYGRRGTAEGLREALLFFLGVEARIEEPILETNWWALADESAPEIQRQTSLLGYSTVLVAAEPQGAVLGTTATLDRSHLIGQSEFGAPLFDDVAHRLCVSIYRGASYSEAGEQRLRQFLDREVPAHTAYHLGIIEPRMRIGLQARVGVDTVLAGPESPAPLPAEGSAELILAGDSGGRIGASRLGKDMRVG